MILQIALARQEPAVSLRAGSGIDQETLRRVNSLSRGESFEVDIRDAGGKIIRGGATVTLAGEDGSYGAYIQLKGSSTRWYHTGTTADGKYVPPHRISADGTVTADVSDSPQLHLTRKRTAEKILGLKNAKRRGYSGSYQEQTAANGTVSYFYTGGAHTEGQRCLTQTFDSGIWKQDGAFAKLRVPTSEELDKRIVHLRTEKKELQREYEEKKKRYDRLVSNKTPARVEILEVDTSDPQEPVARLRFEELDTAGEVIATRTQEVRVQGKMLYFDALTVSFTDELIESGAVSGHPTLFRSVFGSADIVSKAPKLSTFPKHPESSTANGDEAAFIAQYASHQKEGPQWSGFWDFAKGSSTEPGLLAYNENRELFWHEFFRHGNEDAYWELFHDSQAQEALGIRAMGGGGPYINLMEVEAGWKYTLQRRNLGGLEISPPNQGTR